MKVIKEIYKDIDIYGTEVLLKAIKKNFRFCSYTKTGKTPAKAGSHTISTAKMKTSVSWKVKNIIFHKNKTITLITSNDTNFTFLN